MISAVREKFLFASTHSIMEVDVYTYNMTVLFGHKESYEVFSLDYDYQNGYVYFPRYNVGDIVR